MVYQLANVGARPVRALGWTAMVLSAFATVVWALHLSGRRQEKLA